MADETPDHSFRLSTANVLALLEKR